MKLLTGIDFQSIPLVNATVATATVSDSSLKIANTAFIKSQSYLVASALTPYALLAGATFSGALSGTTGSFTGIVTVPTATAVTNTTQIATTQYVTTAISNIATGSGYALLAGATFTGNVNGINLNLTTAFAVGTGGLSATSTANFYTAGFGYTGGSGITTSLSSLAQFGTTSPLNILQTTNSTSGGVSAFTGIELASNNSWSGSTRTATVAGYAQSIGFDTTNGVLNFYSTASSLTAATVLTGPGGNMPRIAYITAAGAATFSSYVTAYGINANGGYFNNAVIGGTSGSPYIQINTSDTGRNAYGIQPSSTSVGIATTNTYSYTANMSNDPASSATSAGPTMELSLFASVYTGNAAAKTLVRTSANSGLILAVSTVTASGTAPTVFPKLAFGTSGLASGYTILGEYAKFAANSGNLMLFTSTAMASDSTQADSGDKLQVYGTGYFSGKVVAATATAGTNTTQLATTAFVTTAVAAVSSGSGYAPIASPTFTGIPAAPTATSGTNTTQLATTAYVTTAIAGVSGSGVLSITSSNTNNSTSYANLTASSIWTIASVTAPTTGTYRITYNGQYLSYGENYSIRATSDLNSLISNLSTYTQTATHGSTFTTETLTTGVYVVSGAATSNGTLTFDAQNVPSATFIIKIGGAFASAANSIMVLANGALATNIFWVVGGAPTTGANSTFLGNVICNTAISMGDTTAATGRFFSTAGAIASTNVTINVPPGVSAIPLNSLANFIFYTTAGALANTGTNNGIGDIGTGAGAITNYSGIHGNQYPTPNLNARGLFSLYNTSYGPVANSTRVRESQAYAYAQTIDLEGIYYMVAGSVMTALLRVDSGTYIMGNQIITIELFSATNTTTTTTTTTTSSTPTTTSSTPTTTTTPSSSAPIT